MVSATGRVGPCCASAIGAARRAARHEKKVRTISSWISLERTDERILQSEFRKDVERARSLSEFDSALSENTLLISVLHFAHLGDGVSQFDETRMRIAPGQNNVHHLGAFPKR